MVKVAVFGLGFVGHSTAMGMANAGYDVRGVDIDEKKVKKIRGYHATIDPAEAMKGVKMVFICVPTPAHPSGEINVSLIYAVAKTIAENLKYATHGCLVVMRSTVLPGMTRNVQKLIQACFKGDFSVCHNPEFLREKTAMEDFNNPIRILIGCDSYAKIKPLREFYQKFDAQKYFVDIEVSEAVKYTDNTFHALKAAFANEMGRLWESRNVDGKEVMKIIASEYRLNSSSAYLKPGWAFGGNCLPKDVNALSALDFKTPLIDAILESNEIQKEEDDKRTDDSKK